MIVTVEEKVKTRRPRWHFATRQVDEWWHASEVLACCNEQPKRKKTQTYGYGWTLWQLLTVADSYWCCFSFVLCQYVLCFYNSFCTISMFNWSLSIFNKRILLLTLIVDSDLTKYHDWHMKEVVRPYSLSVTVCFSGLEWDIGLCIWTRRKIQSETRSPCREGHIAVLNILKLRIISFFKISLILSIHFQGSRFKHVTDTVSK